MATTDPRQKGGPHACRGEACQAGLELYPEDHRCQCEQGHQNDIQELLGPDQLGQA